MREIDSSEATAAPAPAGEPLDAWEVAAIGPQWRPAAGEPELEPVPGSLELYPDALVFRAHDAVDRRDGAPLVSVVAAGAVTGAAPLAPGARISSAARGGGGIGRLLRRLAPPGFVLSTSAGPWAFECTHGERRADDLRRRYA